MADTQHITEAARITLLLNPYFIDLNLKCPSKKVVGKGSGSFSLFDLLSFEKSIGKAATATKPKNLLAMYLHPIQAKGY